MNPRVLIAPDKFKGTLTSPQVAEAIARGLRRSRPDWRVTLLPIADGGEGTTEALLAGNPGVNRFSFPTFDPFLRPLTAEVAVVDNTAIFDCAAAVGMTLLNANELDPWRASTRGLGALARYSIRQGASRILIGLGGSATNDAGLGLAAELGWKFLDLSGNEIEPVPANFASIEKIIPPPERLSVEVIGLCDVSNPLLGPMGASEIYGRQKGVRDPSLLDAQLARVAALVTATIGRDYRNTPGAGAAGGLGFGLLAFCGGELKSGFTYLSELMDYEDIVQRHDLIITGEGKIDQQTSFGKGPAALALVARRNSRAVIAFCGVADPGLAGSGPFDRIIPIVNERVSLKEALAAPSRFLEEAVYLFCQDFNG